ncbi:NAD(P)H-dependent oxidoreductase [Saccharopolyspora dendranthemae]|uniref:NAD(P)H-dependent FMN reductase n=1 Tax=Saccharopolyspora dendranthemae TaxID=1181886 RepID=A0A561U9R5_9PSEU|nr:NAD(P)H-dependent oxidoreductase [Saccharopolyspora dendranthemae]TWF96109.1 NAD(P)H-dependent FMN reductase [Saccharopolyspora dendranthemae]
MAEFALLTGHLSSKSRPGAIIRTVGAQLRAAGGAVVEIEVGELPHSVLMAGDDRHPEVRSVQRALSTADAVAVVIPRYEPHGSVPLRALLGLLRRDVLAGKPVLPLGLGTVRSQSIGLGGGLGGGEVLPAAFLYDDWFSETEGWAPDPRARELLRRAANDLWTAAVGEAVAA